MLYHLEIIVFLLTFLLCKQNYHHSLAEVKTSNERTIGDRNTSLWTWTLPCPPSLPWLSLILPFCLSGITIRPLFFQLTSASLPMIMDASTQPPKDVVLICMTGEPLRAPRSLLAEASPYLKSVLDKCASPVLVMPDVTLGEMVELIEYLKGDGPSQVEGRLLEIAQRYSIRTSSPKSTPYLPFKKRRLELTPPSSPELAPQDVRPSPPKESPEAASSSPARPDSPTSSTEEPRGVTPPALSPSAVQGPMGAFPLLPFLLQSSMLARSGMFQASPAFPHLLASSPQAQLQSAAMMGQTSPVLPRLSPHEPSAPVTTTPVTPLHMVQRPSPYAQQQAQSPAAASANFPGWNSSQQALVPCEDCGKSFTVSNLTNHRRRNHRLLQEPVVCCGEQFPTRWHLRLHRRSINHRRTHWQPALSTAYSDDARPLSPTYSD